MIPFVAANGDVMFIAIVIKAEEGKKTTFRIALEAEAQKRFSIRFIFDSCSIYYVSRLIRMTECEAKKTVAPHSYVAYL